MQSEPSQPDPEERSPLEPISIDLDDLDGGPIKTFDNGPELKLQESHGVFLWWSDRLPQWIHPDDLELAESLVPGFRVFRRIECQQPSDREAGYLRYEYGQQFIRALPIIWLEIEPDGFAIGDRVEIKSDGGKRRPGIGTICDRLWNRQRQQIEYRLDGANMPRRRKFSADELQPAVKLGDFLSEREQNLRGRI